MKFYLKLLSGLFIAGLALAITYTPSSPAVGQTITFKFSYSGVLSCKMVTWDFGDGTQGLTTGDQAYNKGITHFYKDPGTYAVVATPSYCVGTPPPAERATVTVREDRYITVEYVGPPIAGYPIKFRLINAKSPPILWRFGDGTEAKSQTNEVVHHYSKGGVYKVEAYDFDGTAKIPVTKLVSVKEDSRKVEWIPTTPAAGQTVVFRAINFASNSVFWDFGDGYTMIGSRIVKHIYRRHGTYTLRVKDMAGRDFKVFSYTLRIKPGVGAFLALTVRAVELYFENNGRGYIVVPFDYRSLIAKARIKYEGSGTLQGYWTIDGKPFYSFTRNLMFGRDAELVLKGIPALEPGLHRVSLVVTNPPHRQGEDIEFPVIYYFVSATKRTLQVLSPKQGEIFLEGQKIRIEWQEVPEAIQYRLLISRKVSQLFAGAKEIRTEGTSWIFDAGGKKGRYYLIVMAMGGRDLPVCSSEIISFFVKESPTRIEFSKAVDLIKGLEVEKLQEGSWYLIPFKMKFPEVEGRKLLRVYLNGKLVQEEFIPEGVNSFETSIKAARKNEIEIRVYLIKEGSLSLIGYRKIELR